LLKADIESCFDRIPFKQAMSVLDQLWGISKDRELAETISGLLAPMEGKGIAQGSALSPLVANVFLDHYLDRNLIVHGPYLVVLKDKDDTQPFLEHVQQLLEPVGMQVNAGKTRIYDCNTGNCYNEQMEEVDEPFEYLGVELRNIDGQSVYSWTDVAIRKLGASLYRAVQPITPRELGDPLECAMNGIWRARPILMGAFRHYGGFQYSKDQLEAIVCLMDCAGLSEGRFQAITHNYMAARGMDSKAKEEYRKWINSQLGIPDSTTIVNASKQVLPGGLVEYIKNASKNDRTLPVRYRTKRMATFYKTIKADSLAIPEYAQPMPEDGSADIDFLQNAKLIIAGQEHNSNGWISP
jgi:hypothetical protein